MAYVASILTGAVVGLICTTVFAVTLRRIEEKNPSEAIKALGWLISIVLGGGLADYIVFDFVIKSGGAIAYYMMGLAVVFLSLGLLVFFDWRRK